MQIRPTSNLQSTNSVQFQSQSPTQNVAGADALPVDQLEISAEAQMLSASSTEIRADKVAELRTQIASGQYETSEKLDAAISRMLNELV